MIEPLQDDEIIEHKEESKGPVQILLRLASTARLYRAADGRLHARVPVGDRYEIYGLKSPGFRDWLIDGFFADRHEPPSQWAILRVVSVLEARARFDGGMPSVFIRVGRDGDGHGSAYFLDLGDPSGRAIKIRADGWYAVDRPSVHFRRPEGLLPLPTPSHDGSIELLRRYVNLTDSDFRLVLGWLTAALRPVGPYPILAIHGEHGSAKSTLARILRLLIDPQACPLSAEPKSTRDLMATALNGWLLAYDNISVIPAWLSDSLCRLVFGGGFAGRALYSNDELSVIHAQRPVILNGIEDFVRKSDLVDRTVFLHLPAISQTSRRAEHEFWRSFQTDYSRILGGVLDAVAGGLRELPSVHLPKLPRMADFAQWGEAVGRGLGWPAGTFLATYSDNSREATETALEGSLVGQAMLELAADAPHWESTPTDLLRELTAKAGGRVARSAGWPKSVQIFTNEVRRLAPQLRVHGLSVIFRKTYNRRLVTLTTLGVPPMNQLSPDANGPATSEI